MNIPEHMWPIVGQNLNMETSRQEKLGYWAVILRLKIQIDGNQYILLWGENLQEGIAAFGSTPVEAIQNFEKAMYAPLTERKGIVPPADEAGGESV